MKLRLVVRLLIVVVVAALLWGGYEVLRRHRGYQAAAELARYGLWERARGELQGYLELHPHDAQARYMMAELWVADDALDHESKLPRALEQLRQIPDEAPLASAARTQQAKLQFLVAHKPVAAEQLLNRAIFLDEKNVEAHLLLSKLMEMTGRYHQVEDIFWRIYELTPPELRAERLRDWYMTQFFPATVNDEMDQNMGFAGARQGSLPAEAVRYLRFRETEPDQPLARAALARWTRQSGKPSEALNLLDVADDNLDNELRDPFFVTTLIDLLIDVGDYERADEHFRNWPGDADGHDYWRLKALILEEVHQDYKAALEAYDRALEIWPGPSDWRLLHRKAGCLALAGMREESVKARERAEQVEQLMQDDVHRRLRYVLGFLDQPEELREVVDFYQQLGREREANAWSIEIARRMADKLK